MKVIDFVRYENCFVVVTEIAKDGDLDKLIRDKEFQEKPANYKLRYFV